MDYKLIFISLTALFSDAFAQNHLYYFVNTPHTWTDAQTVCRRDYTDLATLDSSYDISAVNGTSSSYSGKAWIGLYDGWKWSLGDNNFYGEQTTYRNWAEGEPNNYGGDENCVDFYFSGTWNDLSCSSLLYFVCYNGTVNGQASLLLISQLKTWAEAQSYCWTNYVDLASVRNQTDNDKIKSLIGGFTVWIGVYRQELWSDGSNSTFRYWAAEQPTTGPDKCVASSFGDSGKWSKEICSQSFPFICRVNAPQNPNGLKPSAQNETSITLQWNEKNYKTSFVLQFNGTETNISAPDENGPVTHTVSSLTAGSKYTFTLFCVFENIRSSGVQLTAATAPPNTNNFRSSEQNETSITLQWSKVNNNVSFVLQFNGTETIISAPTGDGPVTYTVSSLTAGAKYTFTLFSVFENIRSSGVQLTAATGPVYKLILNARFSSLRHLAESEIEDILAKVFKHQGHLLDFSLKARIKKL